MTTVMFVNKICYVCGTTGRFAEIGIRNLGRPEDLDTRPGDSQRTSLYMIMKRCTSCGYCAPDITAGQPSTQAIVKSTDYQNLLHDSQLPETANTFLCWSKIKKEAALFSEAGKAILYAAWTCDDGSEFREKAIELRKEAYSLLNHAKKLNQPFGKTDFEEQLLLIDLLRRSGSFDEAETLIDLELKKQHSEDEEMILEFVQEIVQAKDLKRHSLSEALKQ